MDDEYPPELIHHEKKNSRSQAAKRMPGRVRGPNMPEIKAPAEPLWASPVFWGALGIMVTLLATYLGFALGDLRWFLVAAWPFLAVVFWEISIRITRPSISARVSGFLIDIAASGVILYILSTQIPPPVPSPKSPDTAPQFEALKQQLHQIQESVGSQKPTVLAPKSPLPPPVVINNQASLGNLKQRVFGLAQEISHYLSLRQEEWDSVKSHWSAEDIPRHYRMHQADTDKGFRYLYEPRVIAIVKECADLHYDDPTLDSILAGEKDNAVINAQLEEAHQQPLPVPMATIAALLVRLSEQIKQP
jgi:hypothetical protein